MCAVISMLNLSLVMIMMASIDIVLLNYGKGDVKNQKLVSRQQRVICYDFTEIDKQ